MDAVWPAGGGGCCRWPGARRAGAWRAVAPYHQATLFFAFQFLFMLGFILFFVGGQWRETRYLFLVQPAWLLAGAAGAVWGIDWLLARLLPSISSPVAWRWAATGLVALLLALSLWQPGGGRAGAAGGRVRQGAGVRRRTAAARRRRHVAPAAGLRLCPGTVRLLRRAKGLRGVCRAQGAGCRRRACRPLVRRPAAQRCRRPGRGHPNGPCRVVCHRPFPPGHALRRGLSAHRAGAV